MNSQQVFDIVDIVGVVERMAEYRDRDKKRSVVSFDSQVFLRKMFFSTLHSTQAGHGVVLEKGGVKIK